MIKMSEIQVIDNFLDDSDFEKIRYHIADDPDMVWSYRCEILPEDLIECDPFENHMYAFTFCNNGTVSTNFSIIHPLLQKLDCNSLVRAKANSTWARSNNIKIGWHTDNPIDICVDYKIKTAIYYLNTNDGSTIIQKSSGEEVTVNCVENRVVIFNSWLKHTGVTCTDTKRKLLINLNYV